MEIPPFYTRKSRTIVAFPPPAQLIPYRMLDDELAEILRI